MNLLIAIIMFSLFCCPTTALSQREGGNNLFYEFFQSDGQYTFYGSFFTMADPDELMHILFDFEHLTRIVTSADSIALIRQGKDWYEVRYTYRIFLSENKFIYRKSLIPEKQRIIFELIESDQRSPVFPKILSSRGYYEIHPEWEGYRVIYVEEVRIGSRLPNEVSSHVAKKEAVKFLQELKKYVENKCN